MAASDPTDKVRAGILWYFTTAADSPCPGEEALAEYALGTVQGRRREAIERHAAVCSRCAQTLDEAAALIGMPDDGAAAPVPEAVLERLQDRLPRRAPTGFAEAVHRLLRKAGFLRRRLDSLVSFRRPELVYVRGRKKVISKNLIVVERTFASIKLVLEVEKTDTRHADIKIIATRPRTGARFHGVRVDLRAGRREVASFVAERGEVLFEQVAFGAYRIVARDDKRTLGDIRLTIKE